MAANLPTVTPVLRTAAEKLRTLAARVVHQDRPRWHLGETLGSKTPVVLDAQEQPSVLVDVWAERREDVNAYLAAYASPHVARAVADWLGCEAALDDEERGRPSCAWCGTDHARTIAALITGGTDQ
ncbi:hypothetical protein ABZ567_31295 [Streptomyces sp. NPDC016459]|uniref:hypothetical protein n=1 Tax=Streptomyces sp. NPDC016459 TaxID=3157190 RepID=UPI0033F58043